MPRIAPTRTFVRRVKAADPVVKAEKNTLEQLQMTTFLKQKFAGLGLGDAAQARAVENFLPTFSQTLKERKEAAALEQIGQTQRRVRDRLLKNSVWTELRQNICTSQPTPGWM